MHLAALERRAVDEHLAAVAVHEAGDHVGDRLRPGPAQPEEPEALADADLERDVVDGAGERTDREAGDGEPRRRLPGYGAGRARLDPLDGRADHRRHEPV